MALNAIEFPENSPWINSPHPLTLNELKGNVVMLCFWNFFSTSCIRATQDLHRIKNAFSDRQFIIVFIHSSQFGGAISTEHVALATLRHAIRFPVMIDNTLDVWNSYGIYDWPSYVIIDAEGNIMGSLSGEGKADRIIHAVERALEDGAQKNILRKSAPSLQSQLGPPSLLSFPGKIEIDREKGHLFVSDTGHHRVLHLSLEKEDSARIIAEYGGRAGFRDGRTIRANFRSPMGLCLLEDTLYVADSENHAIRAIDLKNREVSTVAGTGMAGFTPSYSGNPQKISLNTPMDIVASDRYLFIAMAGLNQIWQFDLDNNYISNFIGSGLEGNFDGPFSAASLAKPCGISIINHMLYIADANSSAVRSADLKSHILSTLIGKGLYSFGYIDGHFSDARMLHPTGIEAIKSRLFIADTYNNAVRFSEIPGNVIRSLIGPKPDSSLAIIENSELMPLCEPNDLVYYNGKLYIADSGNHQIRLFDISRRTLSDMDIS